MKNILIVDGHQSYEGAKGKLNRTLTEHMVNQLKADNRVQTTFVQEGYNIEQEQHKYLWADVVIYQTPVYWFSVPGLMKTYMDEVFAYGIFFEGSERYGEGGLLKGKKYFFSTTWNAPQEAFEDRSQFFGGITPDEALVHLHRTHIYCGMETLPGYACYDVISNPQVDRFLDGLTGHLKNVLSL
ncbi:NAD(P)H-dependent oxidoreductase [Paenibacillus gansuensis]|uniref:NAD(P)H-dependent oxidoreductase n=1 Tax=Paenibacillus gansuensis TaxID=306542 RepID=A0ABW5P8T8_9BACL